MSIVDPPGYVASVLRQLADNGYAAYLVGGCVRDSVMGRGVSDWDIATSATPTEVTAIFPKTVLTGEKYGTVTVLSGEEAVEVTTFRADGAYVDGRRPESVEFGCSIKQDLSRRDFTVNAMAATSDGEIMDPFGGRNDIQGRIIRCVGNPNMRFQEDALRMFRAYRFCAQLGFSIKPATIRAIYANADRAGAVSAERVRVEVEKTLMSERPETVGQMIEAGLLDRYLAQQAALALQAMRALQAEAALRAKRALWAKQTIQLVVKPGMLERIAALPEEPVVRWCALCAVLLETRSIASASAFLRGMRLDTKTTRVCSNALSIPSFPEDRIKIKRFLAKYGEETARCAAAVADALDTGQESVAGQEGAAERGDAAGRGYAAERGDTTGQESVAKRAHLAKVEEIVTSGECFSLRMLAVKGRDLIAQGHPPGKELGATLSNLLAHVIEHPEDNVKEILLEIAEGDGYIWTRN